MDRRRVMLSRIKEFFGLSEESAHEILTETTDFPGVVVDTGTSPLPIADGGKEWDEVRTKTPDEEVKTPARSETEIKSRYREAMDGISKDARERLTFLVENYTFDKMPGAPVRTEWGIEHIGSGNFRTVYGFQPDSKIPMENPEQYVLKVTDEFDSWTNEEEAKAWYRLEPTPISDYLAPVVDFGHDFRWVLMKRVDHDTEIKPSKQLEMQEECKEFGWEYHDWKPSNMGYIEKNGKEKPVLVDYGYHQRVTGKLKAD